MILVDTNVLVYAVDSNSPHNRGAKAWLEQMLSGRQRIGLAWVVILAFLRVTTRPSASQNAMPLKQALDMVDMWLGHSSIALVHPGPEHANILRDVLLKSGTIGNRTTDAHLAALAIEHNATLYSYDHDFARFAGLRWRRPA